MRRSLFVLIDALGWEKVCETEFLPELAATRGPLKTVLGYSGACQAALLSGRPPSETGHWLMYYFISRTQTFGTARVLGILPGWIRNRGRVRRWLARSVERKGIRGYYSLYDVPMELFPHLELAEKESIYAPGGLSPARGIFDDLSSNGTPYAVWDWRVPEPEGLERLLREIREDRRRFYLIYWTKLDALMHEYGTRAPAVDEHVRWYEAAIRRLLEEASRLPGETRVFVFSDHGMIDTTGTLDLMGAVERLAFKPLREYVAFYDSTLARFSFFGDGARRKVEAVLSEQTGGDLLDDDALRALGVFFEDRRYGERVFLTHPGILISPSYMGASVPRAMHGFSPSDPRSDAFLASNVSIGRQPVSIMDLYGIMRAERGQ